MQEIRFHGRGGQGTVVASKVLAVAIAMEGKHIQAFPEFGVERRGAPVVAFLRINEGEIYQKSRIYDPDHIVILDPTLMGSVNVTEGLKDGGWIIVNTERSPEDVPIEGNFRIATVDAYRIAVKHGVGSKTAPIVNTAILGAVNRVLKLCTSESLAEAIRESVPIKQAENVAAATDSYDTVSGGNE
jgi:2-oxoacid:acceptor oxidoreductase gamma subunit (pyruvate/2-ketoisovalerate family)